MDTLKFACAWGKASTVPGAKVSTTIVGFKLEGCLFDGSRLSSSQRNSLRYEFLCVCGAFHEPLQPDASPRVRCCMGPQGLLNAIAASFLISSQASAAADHVKLARRIDQHLMMRRIFSRCPFTTPLTAKRLSRASTCRREATAMHGSSPEPRSFSTSRYQLVTIALTHT
jgi:hypothetical protein